MTEPQHERSDRLRDIWAVAGLPLLFVTAGGRLPFAMNVVGVLLLLTVSTGSVAAGAIGSATVGLSVALSSPAMGILADRYGQRWILALTVPFNALALVMLTVGAQSRWEMPVLIVLCALVGLSTPQLSPLMRARWTTLLRDNPRAVPVAMGYESFLDDLSFVAGPVVVSVIALAFGAAAPVIVSAALTVAFAVAFGLHASARLRTVTSSVNAAPSSTATLRVTIFLVVAAMLVIGVTFGVTLTLVTAFAKAEGSPESAGLIYAAMSISAATASITGPILLQRLALKWRWILGALAIAVGVATLMMAAKTSMILVALSILGMGIGITIVSLYARGGQVTSPSRMTTLMTTMGGATALGSSIGVLLGGLTTEPSGRGETSLFIAIAVATLLIAVSHAIVNSPRTCVRCSGK